MKRLIRYTALLISLVTLLFPQKAAQACGFMVYPGEYRFWLLQPDLTNEPDLSPFFFAASYIYKGDMYNRKETYPDQNIEEWFVALKQRVPKTDIDSLLNMVEPQDFFDNQKTLAHENKLLRFALLPENKDLLRYLILSKKVEQASSNLDPWKETSFKSNYSLEKIIREGQDLLHDAKNSFVRFRTAFQLIRSNNHTGNLKELNRLYSTIIVSSKRQSWIKTAALYQKALSSKDYEQDYLLSKVFDIGGYNRTICLVRFNSNDFQETLKLAKNSHERTVIKAIKVFNYPGRSLDLIQKIYQAEPRYKELPFLLLREMNKVEDWLLTNKVTSFGTPAVYNDDYSFWGKDYLDQAVANHKRDIEYANRLHNFIDQIIKENRSGADPLMQLYAAHLSLLQKDYSSATMHLQMAKASKHLAKNVKTQIELNEFLLHLENGFHLNTENEFMSILKKSDAQLGINDPEIMRNQLILYTARKLIKQGDRAKGLMLLSRTNRALGELPIGQYRQVYQEIEATATAVDYDLILQILGKKNRSDFEKFVSTEKFRSPMEFTFGEHYDKFPDDTWSKNKVLDCKASWYLRNHRLQDASNAISPVPDSFYQKSPYSVYIGGNPFYLDLDSAHTITKADKISLDKKQVIAQMLALEKLAASDKTKKAEAYFQLANAWYNMTYYGKNWLMVKQWWSAGELDENNPDFKESAFNNDYFGCEYAKNFYRDAIRSTKDKKLAALCMYMISECNKNARQYRWNLRNSTLRYWEYKDKTKQDPRELQHYGIDAGYYYGLVKECELYRSFIQQYNHKL